MQMWSRRGTKKIHILIQKKLMYRKSLRPAVLRASQCQEHLTSKCAQCCRAHP